MVGQKCHFQPGLHDCPSLALETVLFDSCASRPCLRDRTMQNYFKLKLRYFYSKDFRFGISFKCLLETKKELANKMCGGSPLTRSNTWSSSTPPIRYYYYYYYYYYYFGPNKLPCVGPHGTLRGALSGGLPHVF